MVQELSQQWVDISDCEGTNGTQEQDPIVGDWHLLEYMDAIDNEGWDSWDLNEDVQGDWEVEQPKGYQIT